MKIMGYKTNLIIDNKKITWVFAGILLLTVIFSGFAGFNTPKHVNSNLTIPKTAISLDNSWTYGSNNFDDGFAIANDSLGNIFLAGITKKTGQYDVILIKVDQNGNEAWNKTWDAGGVENTHGVAIDNLGNIYITGFTTYGVGIFDMFLIKYDSLGAKEWNLTRGVDSTSSYGHKIAFDSSLNPYIVGTHDSDIILYKYSTSGVYQWNRTWDGGSTDNGYDIYMDEDDNIYIAGSTKTLSGDRDVIILRYDSPNYNILTDYTTWGGDDDDYGNSIYGDETGIYIGGGTWSYGAGGQDILLIKYNYNLMKTWNITFGTSNLNETSNSIAISGNSILLGGNIGVNYPVDDAILVEIDKLAGLYLHNDTWDSGHSDLSDGIIVHSNGYVYMILTADYPDPTKSEIVLLKWDIRVPDGLNLHPVLSYSPLVLDFGNMESNQLSTGNITIWNSGNGTLTWNIIEDYSWITVSPEYGFSDGENDTIIVNVNTNGLSAGDYNAIITIKSNEASENISLTVSISTAIPGFSIFFLLIAIIGLVSILIIRKTIYKPKIN
ncbi:MAG: hypothetical protein EU551_04355 [Promethearchaeota archaeon]|nr:MAG: hypothetical protein EU551_04355 [Candidatus Lokiarchaeota archaeon]